LVHLILFQRLWLAPTATAVAGPAYVALLETSGCPQRFSSQSKILVHLILFQRLWLAPTATAVAGPAYVALLETSGCPQRFSSQSKKSPHLLFLFPSVPLSRAKKTHLQLSRRQHSRGASAPRRWPALGPAATALLLGAPTLRCTSRPSPGVAPAWWRLVAPGHRPERPLLSDAQGPCQWPPAPVLLDAVFFR
jgi:hypothetical protein